MTARLTALAASVLLCASVAAAQTPAPPKPAGPKRDREFVVGGVVTGPMSMGSVDAALLGSGGATSVVLFRTENERAPGFGPEVSFGFQIRRKVWVEVAGGLLTTALSTRIVNDFEGAADVTIESPVTRFSAEGALLWYFRQKGKTSWFVRGSGGILRDTSGDLTLAESGFIGGGGVGLKYWWRTNGKGTFKRIGLRAEFRALVQAGGASLGDRSISVGPAGACHLVFGY